VEIYGQCEKNSASELKVGKNIFSLDFRNAAPYLVVL
jgi:hypothetical protein